MGSEFYNGKYTVTFISEFTSETKNTFDDFHLAPASRPVVNPPKQKTSYIDIPGMNGRLDASEILTGYPVFENRTGSLSFYVLNGYEAWYDIYNNALAFLHGRDIKMILEEEPLYFYIGKFAVNKWESKKDNSEITIDYDVEPYKWAIETTTDDWLWDIFDFELGIIGQDVFDHITISSEEYTEFEIDPYYLGAAPICPVITVHEVTDTLTTKIYNAKMDTTFEHELVTGDNQFPDLVLHRTDAKLYFKGTGEISITFRKGML